jgi:hypothetical protein
MAAKRDAKKVTNKVEKTWEQQAEELGRRSMSSIRDMVAALECDYERLEELQGQEKLSRDEKKELTELKEAAGECTSREDAEQRIQEDPLSLQFRSGWSSSKEEMEPEEFELLLGTGGPAVRIIGEVGPSGAENPHLQIQDWWKPWTDYNGTEADEAALETYCRCFYMGE